jgi:hypothetical protein
VLAGRLGVDRLQDELSHPGVGLEGVQPVDDLALERLGLDHLLLAGAVVASR